MSSITEAFARQGLHVTDADIVAAVEALASYGPVLTAVGADERDAYDDLEFPEGQGADIEDRAVDAATRYAALRSATVTVAEAAARLGVDRVRVQQMVTDRKVWALRDGRVWRLPVVQFAGQRLVPGLAEVLPRIPAGSHPLSVLGFLTTPQAGLGEGVAPLRWLATGGTPEALAAYADNWFGTGE